MAVMRRRVETVPSRLGVLRMRTVKIKAGAATALNDLNSCLTLTVSVERDRERALGNLVRDARSQLPEDAPGAVFIQGVGAAGALNKLQHLLTTAATPIWGALWDFERPTAFAWKHGQPFDLRIAEPTPILDVHDSL